MAEFPNVALPRWPSGGVSTETLTGDIAEWLDSPAMSALVEAFGGTVPTGDIGERLAALERFSLVWDGRNNGERLTAAYPDYPAEIRALVDAAARALGLSDRGRPAARRYEHVVVHGGGLVTGRARARFAADLLAEGIGADTVTALGSLRDLALKPADAGDAVRTEGDAMLTALVEAFTPAGGVTRRDGDDWWVQTFTSGDLSLSTVAAPSTRPGQRANTADTLIGWAELVTRPKPEDSVLLVTTDLFVPFQHTDAIGVLGLTYRCGIETVGFSTRGFHGWRGAPSSTGQVLQELRSAICSALVLHRRIH